MHLIAGVVNGWRVEFHLLLKDPNKIRIGQRLRIP
jgi:hypothetical protein